MFAAEWLEAHSLFDRLISEPLDKDTYIIIVVPAYDEPGITCLLDSLNSCTPPKCGVEIIVVVNAPEQATLETLEHNELCVSRIKSWKVQHDKSFLQIRIIDTGKAPVKKWGVGLARKTGMDEALRRFGSIDRPEGIIVCLDADCLVASNYLTALEKELLVDDRGSACSIYFEHPVSGMETVDSHIPIQPQEGNTLDNGRNPIILYELYMRYYVGGLRYCGFPYPFHTIGSAIAVKAIHYMKAGGMNRKQAGEDFYFVQKLVQSGRYFALNDTVVYPSSRKSDRVPFGTGTVMGKLITNSECGFYTYCIDGFKELKSLFSCIRNLNIVDEAQLEGVYKSLPQGLSLFLEHDEWMSKMTEIMHNTSTREAFIKRFFTWFNMFQIVKYMNFVHTSLYSKQPVAVEAASLLVELGIGFPSDDPLSLLNIYREIDRR